MHPPRDKLYDLAGYASAPVFGLKPENGDTSLQVGRLDIGDQPPFEARGQPLFEGRNSLGWAVTGNDNLPTCRVECVKCMEELFLCTFLASNELNVVHQQEVGVAVAFAEILCRFIPNGIYKIIRERL